MRCDAFRTMRRSRTRRWSSSASIGWDAPRRSQTRSHASSGPWPVRLRQAALCGLSMGGYVLFELLRRHPERAKALILVDTKAEADSTEAKRRRDELTLVAERHGQDAVIEQLLPRLVAPETLAAQPEVV